MRKLYHHWLSPGCRKVRIALAEKRIDFECVIEKIWERRRDFLALNPAGELPVLVESNGTAISGGNVICEFIDEVHSEPGLFGESPLERAEVRRLVLWFDSKFNREVTENLVTEKVTKRLQGLESLDSQAVRAGHANIHHHLEYLAYLTERRKWTAGHEFSLADIAAAAHLSAIDYLGDVPWEDHKVAHDWYSRVKSRPSMRDVLADQVPGIQPSRHYSNLDF